jgi:hypothetical protein
MMRKILWTIATAILLPIVLVGCNTDFGTVDQGRVISFDKEKGLITMIRDVNHDAKNPDYSSLPPVTYLKPVNPNEMGADPKVGYRMKLDTKKKQIVIYDKPAQNFKTIEYTLVDEQENIDRKHPLVYDNATETAKKFPVVDKDKKQITIYSARQKLLITISVPAEYVALPDYTWDAGDEVRIYFKQPGKALRFMNISKTDIFKK